MRTVPLYPQAPVKRVVVFVVPINAVSKLSGFAIVAGTGNRNALERNAPRMIGQY